MLVRDVFQVPVDAEQQCARRAAIDGDVPVRAGDAKALLTHRRLEHAEAELCRLLRQQALQHAFGRPHVERGRRS